MNLSSNDLKQITRHFIYCPRCKSELTKKAQNLKKCTSCNLSLYINPVSTTGGVIINEKDEILLVRRRVEPGKGLWDIPGGFVDLNETLEESLVREIKEELGINASNPKYLDSKIDMYKYNDIFYQTLGVIFEIKISSKEKLSASDDIDGYKFFSKENFPIEKLAFESLKEFFNHYLD